jgi:SAM-dependent methyltransferase
VDRNDRLHGGSAIDRVGDAAIIDCAVCGFRHVWPLPSESQIREHYRKTHYADGERDRIAYYERDRDWWMLTYGDVIAEVGQATTRRRLLDVGCGAGLFLEAAALHGFTCVGVEPSAVAAAHCRGKGLTILETEFEGAATLPVGSADVIHMRNVLEHVREPRALVESAAEVLPPGGLLVAAVPNDYNPVQRAARAGGVRPWWLAVPHHLNYFDFNSLAGLIESVGFEIVGKTTSFPIDLFLLMGIDYVENPSLGRECHLKRVALETRLEQAGEGAARRALYRAFATAGVGREAIVLARLRG